MPGGGTARAAALARSVDGRFGNRIGGALVEATSTFASVNPARPAEVLATFPDSDVAASS